jgi:hypothetical protein
MRRVAVALAFIALVLAGTAQAYPQTWVSYPRLLAQARSGPLIRAIINPQRKDVEIKFANKDEWHAYYPPGAQASLQHLFDARHILLLFVPRHRVASAPTARGTVHHRLRYIVGGAVVALAVCAGGYLLWRKRRTAARLPG